MPGIPTLKPDTTSLNTVRKHWIFLLVRVQSEPLAAGFAPALVAFGPQWDVVAKQATVLSDALLHARGAAVAKDNVLNRLTDQVSAAIHDGKKPDLSLPRHQLYFGNSTPSDTKKPVLGQQLLTMKPWGALLAKATQPALVALAPAVEAGVADGEAAATAVTVAQAALDKFQLDGALKQLFDTYNALAATTFGGLKRLLHDQPELKLGADWPDSFFLHESRPQAAGTIAQAMADVKRIESELAVAQQRLTDLQVKQTAAEASALAAAEAQQAVDTARKETAAAKQKEKDAIEAAKKARKPKS